MNDRHAPCDALGARLQEAREYVGFSKEEIARHLGLSQAVVSRIESGSCDAGKSLLRSLAKLYQVSVEFLTGHEEQQPDWESLPELHQACADLSAVDRREILRFVRFLHARGSDQST